MDNEDKNNRSILTFFTPKTKSILIEGLRLALLNTVFIVAGGLLAIGLLRGSEHAESLGFILPMPQWLVFFPTLAGYYVVWFLFGKSYGKLLTAKRFLKGYTIGIIGQLPAVPLIYIIIAWMLDYLLVPEFFRIALTILIALTLVLPIMVGFGSTDQKPIKKQS